MTPNDAAVKEFATKEARVYTAGEKALLAAALAIAVLFNRLAFAPLFSGTQDHPLFVGVFWLCFLTVFYAFFWRKLRYNGVAWYVTACCAALCLWGFFFWRGSSHGYFALFNHAVLPGVLMAMAAYVIGGFHLKEAKEIACGWLRGWFIKPFSAIYTLFGVVGSLLSGENKSMAKKVAVGIGVTLPLLLLIVPLLISADQVFGYYAAQFFRRWNFGPFIGHTFFIVITFGFLYSFLWNAKFGGRDEPSPSINGRIDQVISGIVLGTVIVLYIVFCAVMFSYLFAGAGLPGGMTYAEYAREGFAQTVVVCAINLLMYSVFLRYGRPGRAIRFMLVGLLALTGVMLFSGFVRLGLYIDAFGMTWLRLISAWFIIYLAAVILICFARLWKEKIPAMAVCGLVLLGWYVALGYLNPDGFIAWYNERFDFDAWTLMYPGQR